MTCMSYLDQMINLCGVGTLEQDKLLLHLMNIRYFTIIDRHDHCRHCLYSSSCPEVRLEIFESWTGFEA